MACSRVSISTRASPCSDGSTLRRSRGIYCIWRCDRYGIAGWLQTKNIDGMQASARDRYRDHFEMVRKMAKGSCLNTVSAMTGSLSANT